MNLWVLVSVLEGIEEEDNKEERGENENERYACDDFGVRQCL
jgi:hypothetical protein